MSAVGGGMATGSGGGSGDRAAALLTCAPARRSRCPLITDFEDAVPVGPGRPCIFGTPPGLTGRIFAGASPGVGATAAVDRAALGLPRARWAISRPPNAAPTSSSDFYEFGLLFDDCVDGPRLQRDPVHGLEQRAPTVRFSSLSCRRQNVANTDDPRGTCPALVRAAGDADSADGRTAAHSVLDAAPVRSSIRRRSSASDGASPTAAASTSTIDDIMFVNP